MSAKQNQQLERPSSRPTYVLAVIAVLVAAAAAFGMFLWQRSTDEQAAAIREDGYGTVNEAPVAVGDDGAITLGDPEAGLVIDLYADFLCPACATFETRDGQEMAKFVDEGRLAIRYRFVDFLNERSASGDYSTRAAGAALCVAETGDGAVFDRFTKRLLEPGTQPQEGGSDLSNEQLAAIGREVGVPDSAAQCIEAGAQADRAAEAADTAAGELEQAIGTVATPTVLHNGQSIDLNDREWLVDRVDG